MTRAYRTAILSLVQARLAAGQRVRFAVVGHSMRPLLQPGDQLWIESLAAQGARRGDLVAVWRANDIVTHRLVSAVSGIWHTRGDNTLSLDAPIPMHTVLGRVAVVERGHARLDMCRWPWTQANWLLGWLGWIAGCASQAAQQPAHTASLPSGTLPLRPAPALLLALYARGLAILIRLIGALMRQMAPRVQP